MSTLVLGCALAIVAAGIGPQLSRAAVTGPHWADATLRATAEAQIVSLLHEARVLAVRNRGKLPYSEIVLWVDSDRDPGRINESEIVMVTHSRSLKTVTLYRPDHRDDGRTGSIAPAVARSAEFADAWRANPIVRAAVLARGISDMTSILVKGASTSPPAANPIAERPNRDESHLGTPATLRIRLIWAHESADSGRGNASVLETGVITLPEKEFEP